MLWDKKRSIHNIEARWTVDELEKFQDSIPHLIKDLFNIALHIPNVSRELALTIAQSGYRFQDILYKAACLDEGDFTDRRLFIYVDGKHGPLGNIMNAPWDKLLVQNQLFSVVNYKIKNDFWDVLTTHGVSKWKRFRLAGYETIIYRLAVKFFNILPNRLFTKELLMPNENEINIEIASALVLRGVKITKIQNKPSPNDQKTRISKNRALLFKELELVMRRRVEQWITPSGVEVVMSLFLSHIEERIKEFERLTNEWDVVIAQSDVRKKSAVLVNASGNIRGHSLAYSCRKKNIPLISSQHGITVEIKNTKHMLDIDFDNSVADVMLSYNSKIINVEKKSYFDKSKHYEIGMPLRLIRMKNISTVMSESPPIVFISTNLYHIGLSQSPRTNYINARFEQEIVVDILSKLPHKVRYKTYPEDNRRHADMDPVLSDVNKADNIELFSKKIDMRYLVSEHSILVTTCATSTLGWLVMSGKPTVFINQKNNNPLTDEAYKSLSKGIFVFDADEQDFHKNISDFLSQPIDKIERLWQEKEGAREEMLREYFSAYNGGAGKRSAKIILNEYF